MRIGEFNILLFGTSYIDVQTKEKVDQLGYMHFILSYFD